MREQLSMNEAWKFYKGDILASPINGHFATYMHAKAQRGQEAATSSFYDGYFKTVNLPHDYVLEGEVDSKYNESQGSYLRENSWYRKSFRLEEEDRSKRIVVMFEGCGTKSIIWLNGHLVGKNESMYNSFYVDITPYVTFGNEINTLAVQIITDDIEGWWYEGAGIYRNVWMIKTENVAVDVWGTWVNPVYTENNGWRVDIETKLYSIDGNTQEVILEHKLITPEGNLIASTSEKIGTSNGNSKNRQCIYVENPTLWSLDNTALYTMVTKVSIEGEVKDIYETSFGFRKIKFDVHKGFLLNDTQVKLRGACIHQDHANLGVAVPKSVLEYRISKLKEAGFNAYRCSHHNPSPELLEICDRVGMLVMDENRWFNFSEDTQKQIKAMIERDRNHPSVIVWSVGNEEPLQSTLVGQRLFETLKRFINRYDTSRPVTIALNGGFVDSYTARVSDVIGVNYALFFYDQIPRVHENKAIIATESGASPNNRGVYFVENEADYNSNYASAYDIKRNGFGSSYMEAIEAAETRDYISGTFIWTGIEYRGEAAWPKLFDSAGVLDSCCFEKDTYYEVKSLWATEPMLHIMPHWNLKGKEGEKIPVYIFTNVETVEFFVNNESMGKQKVEKFKPPYYEPTYEKGMIKAVGYNKAGKVVIEKEIYTTGEPAKLKLELKNEVVNDGRDAAVIEVTVQDDKGYEVVDAADRVIFETDENTEILAVSNGDPLDHENAKRHDKRLFNGKLQLITLIKEGVKSAVIKARIEERLLETELVITPLYKAAPLKLPICESTLCITSFRIWPKAASKEAIDEAYDFNDMNTSMPVDITSYKSQEKGEGYTVFTARHIMPKYPKDKAIKLRFENVVGEVKIKVSHETNCWPHPTPEHFITTYYDKITQDKETVEIDLKGFSGDEKMNIVLVSPEKSPLSIEKVCFMI